MWRVEGWINKFKAMPLSYGFALSQEQLNRDVEEQRLHDVFEAGADAMLEALRKTCNKHFSGFVQEEGVARFGFRVEKGLWVFIPDDKKEVK